MGRASDLMIERQEALWRRVVAGEITRKEAQKHLPRSMEHDDVNDWLDAAEKERDRVKI